MYELSPRQEILRDDIRGLIKGEVRCDDVSQQIYSTDSGILQCRPAAVVYPRCIEDISSLVRFASERHIPIHARGAGTGRSGESLGCGIVIDFTRFMKKIIALDYEHVTVQSGISRSRLNYTLYRTEKRYFAPSGSSPATAAGSILSRNGAGAYYLRDGFPAEHLLGMTVVLANGSVLTLNRNNLPFALDTNLQNKRHRRILTADTAAGDNTAGDNAEKNYAEKDYEKSSVAKGLALAHGIVNGEEYALADNIHRILTLNSFSAKVNLPKVNRAGYCTEGVLNGIDGHSVDLMPLILGSEGTLALLVEAKLRTVPLPKRQGAAVLFFNQLETAAQSVETILKYQPALCELLDRRRLRMLREEYPKYRQLLPVESEAAVIIELDGGTVSIPVSNTEIQEQLASLIEELQNKRRLCFHSVKINEPEAFQLFDQMLNDSELVLYRAEHLYRSIPLFDDTAVEPQNLPQYINDVLKAVQRCGTICSLSGHIGQGHLRINPFINSAAQDYTAQLRHLSEEVYSVVRQYHGTVSSEGAAGLLKSQFLPEQFGGSSGTQFGTFRQIKELFDPENILNPGKVIPDRNDADIADWTQYLRKGSFRKATEEAERLSHQLPNQLELQLKWEPERFHETVYRCNGCGDCLRTEPDRTMRTCPVYRRFGDEDAAPRSKCNLLRGIIEKDIDLNCLTSHRAKEVADRCIQCGMCLLECPSEVDAAHAAFQIKSAYNAAHSLPIDDLLMVHSDTVLKYLAVISCPVNWALKNKITRWLLEKTFRIPQNRVFPPITKLTFLNRSRLQTWLSKPKEELPKNDSSKNEPKLKVALLIDSYANFFAPEVADAAVKILEHNGIEVLIPPKQKSTGLTAFLTGHTVRAEYTARYNTLLLSDLIRQGYQTVALEPSSAACIANNYRYVCEGDNTDLVSANITCFCTFLYRLHRQGKLNTDFKPLPALAGYHAPCRLIAMTAKNTCEPVPAEQLLRLIPQLEVRRIEQGCCGMAGIYGLKQQNHRHSLQIGLQLFRALKSEDIDFGVSDCSSCLLQMRHGVPEKEMVHPITLLAAAYGFKECQLKRNDSRAASGVK
ncbi:oxidase [Planctomycetales bacterium]|nr:oxidase [Planctomycetales bacterium]